MILPVNVLGQPILRKVAENIESDYPNLSGLIHDMFETMYASDGIGLAAPQIGVGIRLFVLDLSPLAEDYPEYKTLKKVFINPRITEFSGDIVKMEEGCLSVPGIHEYVARNTDIKIVYQDESFVSHEDVYTNFLSRAIQHEYDHLEGKLFVDHISPIRKQLIKSKLSNISKGKIRCSYKIKHV